MTARMLAIANPLGDTREHLRCSMARLRTMNKKKSRGRLAEVAGVSVEDDYDKKGD